jgi:hypothetical protein
VIANRKGALEILIPIDPNAEGIWEDATQGPPGDLGGDTFGIESETERFGLSQ